MREPHKYEAIYCLSTCMFSKSKYLTLVFIRKKDMKTYVEKLRCCSNVAIQMLSATLEVIKERTTYGYNEMA